MAVSLIVVVLCSIMVGELALALPASLTRLENADRIAHGSVDPLHPDIGTAVVNERLRRKVGSYDGPGPQKYMELIRERLEGQEEADATAVWGILDTDVVQNNYRPKPNNGKCTLTQSFHFPMKTLITEYSSRSDTAAVDGILPLTTATLRVYLQTIPRHLPKVGDDFTVNMEVLTAIVDQTNGSVMPSIVAAKEVLTASHSMPENQWLEISITEGIQTLRVNKSHEKCALMVKVVFTLDSCTKKYKKVPLMVVDPATIPVEEKERREKHLLVQPMIILYLDEPEVKEQTKQQDNAGHADEFLIGGSSEQHLSRREASETQNSTAVAPKSACHLENLTINFHAARLQHVIIPSSYNARQCVGQCTISTLKHENDYITNHAQILASAASVYRVEPESFEKEPKLPCCVPITYEEVWLTLLDHATGSFSVQMHPKMVATSCGCR